MERQRISRRRFIGIAAGTVLAASCGTPEEKSPSRSGQGSGRSGFGSGTPTSYREAPMLAEMVEAGELPPVAERLPKEPFVVRPGLLAPSKFVEMRPGKYGGVVQLAQEAPSGDPVIFLGNIEPLLWAPNAFDFSKGIEGNVVEDYEANSDDTRFTFSMREGLRWSDGEPVTMDDVRFAFEDVLYNEEITPEFPPYLKAGRRSSKARRHRRVDLQPDLRPALRLLPGPDRDSPVGQLLGRYKAPSLSGAVSQEVC